jgi:hypothetical protein
MGGASGEEDTDGGPFGAARSSLTRAIKSLSPIKYDPGGVSNSAADMLKQQLMRDSLQQMADKHKMDILMQQGEAQAKASVTEYAMRIRPGTNGGFAVYLDNELFIARDVNELPNVIIAAIGRKKIKA